MAKLLKTNIPGFDDILKGGLREGTSVLITGPPGTGKTVLALQYIMEGAKRGEAGVYITSEETIPDLRVYAKEFGWDIEAYEKKGLVTLIKQSTSPKKLMSIATPLAITSQKNTKRAVLDSITLFEYVSIAGEIDYRREVLDFVIKMKESNVTLLTVSEKSMTSFEDIAYKPEDFLDRKSTRLNSSH